MLLNSERGVLLINFYEKIHLHCSQPTLSDNFKVILSPFWREFRHFLYSRNYGRNKDRRSSPHPVLSLWFLRIMRLYRYKIVFQGNLYILIFVPFLKIHLKHANSMLLYL